MNESKKERNKTKIYEENLKKLIKDFQGIKSQNENQQKKYKEIYKKNVK